MYNQPKPGGVEQKKKKIKPWYLPKTPRVPNVMSCQTMIKAGYQLGIKSKENKLLFRSRPWFITDSPLKEVVVRRARSNANHV